jgi:hypothetical protein
MYIPTYSWPSWRWVVSFTPRPLYPRGKCPRYSLDSRLSEPQNRFLPRGENSWPYQDANSNPSVVQLVASRYTDWAIPAWETIYPHFSISIVDESQIRSERGCPCRECNPVFANHKWPTELSHSLSRPWRIFTSYTSQLMLLRHKVVPTLI